MPEVQKPVLEHAPTEAQNPQVTDGKIAQNSGVVNLVTSVTEIRKMDSESNARITAETSELVDLVNEATDRLCALLVRHGVRPAIWTA